MDVRRTTGLAGLAAAVLFGVGNALLAPAVLLLAGTSVGLLVRRR